MSRDELLPSSNGREHGLRQPYRTLMEFLDRAGVDLGQRDKAADYVVDALSSAGELPAR